MKRILFFILLIPFIAKSQDDSTKYINYRFEYGKRSARLQADSVFNTPLRDTTFHPSRAGSLTTRPQDGKTYQWNGTKWNEYGVGGSGSGTVNNGTQYRIAIYPNNGAAVSENTAITGNRVIVSNSNGLPIASSYTSADLDSLFVSDTISNIGTTGDTILKQVNYHKLGFKPFLSSDFDSPGDSTIAIDATLKSTWNTVTGKLNISDTASMLSPYLRKIDTASLSNRINLKLNISDTTNKWVNNFYKRGDSVFFKKGGTEYFAFIDGGAASDTANLIVQHLGSTGTDVVVPRNDTLYHRLITEGPFIKIDTLTTHELRVSVDTASTDFHSYIALYGNDGGGAGGSDTIQEVAYDSLMAHNIAINTTLKRLTYKTGGYFYHVPITDSVAVPAPPTPDTDAQAYMAALRTASANTAEYDSAGLDAMFKSWKSSGYWAKATRIGMFVYSTQAANLINLKSPGTNNFTLTGSSPTWSTTGVGGFDKTTPKTLYPQIVAGDITQDDVHLGGIIMTANTPTAAGEAMECLAGIGNSSTDNDLRIGYGVGGFVGSLFGEAQSAQGSFAANIALGLDVVTRVSNSQELFYRNGTLLNTRSVSSKAKTDYTTPMEIGAHRDILNRQYQFSSNKIGFFTFGLGLSGTIIGDLKTSLKTYMTILGNNVIP